VDPIMGARRIDAIRRRLDDFLDRAPREAAPDVEPDAGEITGRGAWHEHHDALSARDPVATGSDAVDPEVRGRARRDRGGAHRSASVRATRVHASVVIPAPLFEAARRGARRSRSASSAAMTAAARAVAGGGALLTREASRRSSHWMSIA